PAAYFWSICNSSSRFSDFIFMVEGNKMNVQPYGPDELAAANAAGYLILDWAEGLTHLRAGFRKMDDALPGQNQKLASEGFQQATLGLSIIHDFFKARGIDLSV
ncbi:hypothetical protein, partial [Enterococcus faecalis]|uniref:hypothetical protein n=1 Tax=Enterococcus faecalis TaxID=1351 RepID=UPI0025B19A4E